MSLRHDTYLRKLPSLTRVAATFHSASIQSQLDSIREDISVLFDMIQDLRDTYKRDHADIDNTELDPVDAEITQSQSPPEQQVRQRNFPYL